MWSNIFRVILESTWHKITFWSHFWNCSLLFFLIMGLLPTSLFWKHCLLVPIHEAVSRHCACFIPCPWGKWAMCGQRQWLKFQPWPLFICLQNRSEVYCSLWVCFSYLTINVLRQSSPIQDTEAAPTEKCIVIDFCCSSRMYRGEMGFTVFIFFWFCNSSFSLVLLVGGSLKLEKTESSWFKVTFLTACSLLHPLFALLVNIFNFSHVVSKCFLYTPESSYYKVWIQQEKWSSFVNASSHDILIPLLNHQCCKRFESLGSFHCSCIQCRKFKNSLTGEQPKIYRLCFLVPILSQTIWQGLALFSSHIKLFGACSYSLCTAQQPFPNGLVRWLERYFSPFIICQKFQ